MVPPLGRSASLDLGALRYRHQYSTVVSPPRISATTHITDIPKPVTQDLGIKEQAATGLLGKSMRSTRHSRPNFE
jgi:hypothetical protein